MADDGTRGTDPNGDEEPKKTGWEALSRFIADGADQTKDVYSEAKGASEGVAGEARGASTGVADEAKEASRGVTGEAAESGRETRRTGWQTLRKWFGG